MRKIIIKNGAQTSVQYTPQSKKIPFKAKQFICFCGCFCDSQSVYASLYTTILTLQLYIIVSVLHSPLILSLSLSLVSFFICNGNFMITIFFYSSLCAASYFSLYIFHINQSTTDQSCENGKFVVLGGRFCKHGTFCNRCNFFFSVSNCGHDLIVGRH